MLDLVMTKKSLSTKSPSLVNRAIVKMTSTTAFQYNRKRPNEMQFKQRFHTVRVSFYIWSVVKKKKKNAYLGKHIRLMKFVFVFAKTNTRAYRFCN